MTRSIPRNPRMRAYVRDDAKRSAQREFEALFAKPVHVEAFVQFEGDALTYTNVYDVAEFGRRIIREARIGVAFRHKRNSERIVRINAFVGDPMTVFA